MKQYLPTTLGLACLVLVVALFVMKHGDNAQHEKDTATITDYSNRLDSAQTKIAIYTGTMLTLSNSLDTCRSASLTFSNQLAAAQSRLALDAGQITNLNQRVAATTSENQTLNQQVAELTNQVAGLTAQLASTRSSLSRTNQALAQADKDYALLEDRFRRNVAARVVEERKFRNPAELREQMQFIKNNPDEVISANSIYAGLDVVVNSNGTFHVLSPD